MVANWTQEIIDLHDFFEQYFNGAIDDSLARVEAALSDEFTIVGPSGDQSSRDATLSALRAGHGHADGLVIVTTEHELLVEAEQHLVAAYIENPEDPGNTAGAFFVSRVPVGGGRVPADLWCFAG